MIPTILGLLVMLNPFALFIYLEPVMRDLDQKDFLKVLYKATWISFLILLVFLFMGDSVFEDVFQIHFESFRIFGGVVLFSFAYLFIVKGHKAFIQIKGSLDDLASEIALPFMVGAGMISLVILMGHNYDFIHGVFALLIVFSINFLFLVLMKDIREHIAKKKFRVAFDKVMHIFLRLNGFFVGAIGVDMMMAGIENLFFQ